MTRAATAALLLAVWLCAGLGIRAYFGARQYVALIIGSRPDADRLVAEGLARPEAQLLGMGPWTLLVCVCLAAGVGLALILWPVDSIARRAGASPRGRYITALAVAAASTGAVLNAIHPILSMRRVPEGPRTILNYACEAIGYGWVNGLAHTGAALAGVAVVYLSLRVPSSPTSAPPSPEADGADAKPPEKPTAPPDAGQSATTASRPS